MASAAFSINGATSPQVVASGASISLALLSTSGVVSVSWSIVGWSDSSKTPPSITPGGSPIGATAALTMNGSIGSTGFTLLILCVINGGVDQQGQAVTAYRATGLVGVANTNGMLPFAVGEKFERNAITGIADDMNTALARVGGGTGNVIGAASSTDKGLARFSGTGGKTIQNTSGPKLEDDGRISTLTTPTGISDAVRKDYVDSIQLNATVTAKAHANSPYTLAATDSILEVDTSTGTFQINLPNPSLKRAFLVADVGLQAGVNFITLHRFGTEKILGITADYPLSVSAGSWFVWSNGTNYFFSGPV